MSTSSLLQIIFANLLPSTISLALAASIVAQLHKKNLHHLISYATGLLLAMALLNLLPEAAEGLEAQGASHTTTNTTATITTTALTKSLRVKMAG